MVFLITITVLQYGFCKKYKNTCFVPCCWFFETKREFDFLKNYQMFLLVKTWPPGQWQIGENPTPG